MSLKYADFARKPQKPKPKKSVEPVATRPKALFFFLYFLLFCITGRLFYWQVLHRSTLQAEAESQYTRTTSLNAQRGRLFTQEDYLLVGNTSMYRLFAQPFRMESNPQNLAVQLTPLLLQDDKIYTESTDSAHRQQYSQEFQQNVHSKLVNHDSKWVTLKARVSEEVKKQIEALHVQGIGFDKYQIRSYPEASLAAQVVGFVGKDKEGNDLGYFGVEGALDRELRGHEEKQTFWKDALGFHLLFGNKDAPRPENTGRDVVLTIRRDMQYMVESMLKNAMETYGASAGEVIIMEPSTGKILALADFPNYDPSSFFEFDPEVYKNPSVAASYEPGSTFKVLTMATGVDMGAITPDTVCTNCATARKIGQYTLKTWNNEYHPDITMKDALAKSDNVAMIFASELIGQDKFIEYLKKFGIGEETGIELQEEATPNLRKDWKPIDLATSSFGQGIAVTGLQMVRAVGAIANGGVLMKPTIIDKVIDPVTGVEVKVEPQSTRQVISKESARAVTEMMVYAATNGESKWTVSNTHLVAGKTGTAQIPIDGHYDEKKTIASFIGFAPPNNPKFVMLVKLREPTSSPWASETAAPLWYHIADKLYLLLNIPADK
jgi:cell division protein FtsI (penicillin-binding protein 3)